ncbi:hypothetical protein GQX73_g10108 [Xylaria multiplex]|uniref:WD-like domain-containing protein n=1 Tax=Xylaria multiplex TaxID=323545 RepID=A0A7C8ILL4_9PEZI|nr:hypothetical protein GQX73_g10108 [Xylaria multiplex]
MQVKSIALFMMGATGLMARSLPQGDTTFPGDFVEIDRQPASDGNGTLIFLGPGSEDNTARAATSAMDKRACSSSGSITCDSNHAARNENCDKLVTELFADPTIGVAESPRQICYQGTSGDNAYCCVSWHNVVKNLNKGDLAPIAQNMLSQCTQNGISGKTHGVYVHGKCTDVCLSNRGTHC